MTYFDFKWHILTFHGILEFQGHTALALFAHGFVLGDNLGSWWCRKGLREREKG